MRFAATIAYDGTAYRGFQRQKNAISIQQRLEEALDRISGQAITVIGSGRTDAGVHATGQVIAFDLGWGHDEIDLRNALNANLPADIAVQKVWHSPQDFHPRFDAVSRQYVYHLYVAAVRDPLRDRMAWRLADEIDAEAINEAASWLAGTHDFSAFGTPPQGENPVRTVSEASWRPEAGGQHRFSITANAFLYRMVRTLVGTLVRVGQGQMTSQDFQGILASRQRRLAAPPAPACGLTLVAVTYSRRT
jgi:tRNA pseudouridine38-40 synthase